MALALEHQRALAPLTTLGLGGAARDFVEVHSRDELVEALTWARATDTRAFILGGGSNLVVGDAGVPGLVVRMRLRGVELTRGEPYSTLTVQAGESWDELVSLSVAEQLAGLECLSGIPGTTGATPVQNVGAYGQEVSQVIEAVEVLDRDTLESAWWPASACAFAYRDSCFKRAPDRYVVLSVRFVLRTGGEPTLRYPELARALAARASAPSLGDVQQAVRALRAHKGMLTGAGFPQSAGSFFTNPIVSRAEADEVVRRALARGTAAHEGEVPRFPLASGEVKLAAGFLIESAGVPRGMRSGHVGVSERHALALVHLGGGSTRELMALAAHVQGVVRGAYGVSLQLEPVCWAADGSHP